MTQNPVDPFITPDFSNPGAAARAWQSLALAIDELQARMDDSDAAVKALQEQNASLLERIEALESLPVPREIPLGAKVAGNWDTEGNIDDNLNIESYPLVAVEPGQQYEVFSADSADGFERVRVFRSDTAQTGNQIEIFTDRTTMPLSFTVPAGGMFIGILVRAGSTATLTLVAEPEN